MEAPYTLIRCQGQGLVCKAAVTRATRLDLNGARSAHCAYRAFLRDVLGHPHVDAGHGWLIFALPPAELAIHPSDENDVHELFLMCDDVHELIRTMQSKGVECTPVEEARWGWITRLRLPGGGKLGVYQPKHASPLTKS
jgi:hypothetical protein